MYLMMNGIWYRNKYELFSSFQQDYLHFLFSLGFLGSRFCFLLDFCVCAIYTSLNSERALFDDWRCILRANLIYLNSIHHIIVRALAFPLICSFRLNKYWLNQSGVFSPYECAHKCKCTLWWIIMQQIDDITLTYWLLQCRLGG